MTFVLVKETKTAGVNIFFFSVLNIYESRTKKERAVTVKAARRKERDE